jgi:hypothetical protein
MRKLKKPLREHKNFGLTDIGGLSILLQESLKTMVIDNLKIKGYIWTFHYQWNMRSYENL